MASAVGTMRCSLMCKYNDDVQHDVRVENDAREYKCSRMHSRPGKLMKCSSSLFMLPLFSCSSFACFNARNIVYYHTFWDYYDSKGT